MGLNQQDDRVAHAADVRPIGLIANPASGKDIRRLVARASVFDNQEKANIVRRVVAGAINQGARGLHAMPEAHGLVETALEGMHDDVHWASTLTPLTGSALDTTRAAAAMRAIGCAAVITLGGDGTNRAAAKGWPDAPLIPLSTGTNNVFPRMVEATVAGSAAGLIARGAVALAEAAAQAKRIRVTLDNGTTDIALVDAALVEGRFTGSRALWDASALRMIVLALAEPASIGLSSIGGLIEPVGRDDDTGLCLTIGAGHRDVQAPLAPGIFRPVPLREVRRLALGEPIIVEGPGVLALDGEREHVLHEGQRATLVVERAGPWVIDVERALRLAAARGAFWTTHCEGSDGG